MNGPWREPDAESVDLYPGLVVHDGRVTGSITVGQSRLPVWAFISEAIINGWESANEGYDVEKTYGWTADDMAKFFYYLMEQRGEFGRLVLLLADCERMDRPARPWWGTKKHRKRMADQLRRCLEIMEAEA